MKIYRNQEDGNLYIIFHVKPPKYTGSHFEAQRIYGSKERMKIKEADIGNRFQLVSEKQGNFQHMVA